MDAMKKWMTRVIPVAVLAVLVALGSTTPVDCQDCKPASDRWRCAGKWGSCPLYDEDCAGNPPVEEEEEEGEGGSGGEN